MTGCHYVKICTRTLRDCDTPNECSQQPLLRYKPIPEPHCEPQIIPKTIPATAPPVKIVRWCHCRLCGRPAKETGWRIVQKFSPQCECGSKEMDYDTGTKPEIDGPDDA